MNWLRVLQIVGLGIAITLKIVSIYRKVERNHSDDDFNREPEQTEMFQEEKPPVTHSRAGQVQFFDNRDQL